MMYEGQDNLHLLEESAPAYNRFLARQFLSVFIRNGFQDQQSILDFGAGIGTLAKELKIEGVSSVECLEIDPLMVSQLKKRGFICYSKIKDVNKSFDFVYMSNVLEHIENDGKVLSEIEQKLLAPDGILIIFVPAFQILFSEMDKEVGHFRRYRKRTIRKALSSSGLTELSCEYVDSLGFVALFLLKYLLRKNLSLNSNVSLLKFYDFIIFPISRLLDKLGMRFIFGKNLLLVVKRECN